MFDIMKILLYLIAITGFATASAQYRDASEKVFLSHLDIALRVNTYGVGVEIATPVSRKFDLRLGGDVFPFSLGHLSAKFKDELKPLEYYFGYIPKYRTKLNVDFYNAHVLLDYYPLSAGLFHITAGVYAGSSRAKFDGYVSDPDGRPAQLQPGYEWPVVEYAGNTFDLAGGNLDFDLKLGNKVKPYLGVGFDTGGRRVGFKVEMGVIYQGKYELKQNGQPFRFNKTLIKDFEDVDKYTEWFEWWPILNFQVIYRLF